MIITSHFVNNNCHNFKLHSASLLLTKGQSNLAKGDIAWLIMTSDTAHSCLVDIFYHIHQVTARAAKLVLRLHLRPPFWGKGVVGGQRWYHSKEWWWFPIGSPLWPLRYL